MSAELNELADVLRPLQKIPQPQTATILIVGADGTPKKEFAESMLNTIASYKLQIRLAKYLPLPIANDDQRPNLDFIVFLLEMNNAQSITSVHDSLKYLDTTYFLGRVCFVVNQASNDSIHCTDITDITRLCDSFDSPMLSGNLQTEEDRTILARQVTQMMEIAAGMKTDLSPLLVQATGQSYQYMPDGDT
ncbi:centromere protein M-like isoform X2 [Apostichopus japonicus]